MIAFLVWAARAFQNLLGVILGISVASLVLGFPGAVVYGFWPQWDLTIGVTSLWWTILLSILIREKWDTKP